MKLSIVLAAQLLYRNLLHTSRKIHILISGMLIRVGGLVNLFEKNKWRGALTVDKFRITKNRMKMTVYILLIVMMNTFC